MNPLIWAALLSMTPVGELRAGMPYAMAMHINPLLAFVVCVVANILTIPIVYFFLEFIHHRLLHVNTYQTLFDKFMERTRKKVKPSLDKYGMLGLAVFVAIPLPATGAYTATLAAWFFGMDKWKAFWSIAAGVLGAGVIVMAILLSGMKLFGV